MKPLHIALGGVLVTGILAGVSDALFANDGGMVGLIAYFGPTIIGLAFVFAWLHYDERDHAYRRSALLNIGIVVLAILFVPVYLIRSRPAGRRLWSVLAFFGVVGLWFLVGATTTAVTELLKESTT
jgi:chromate transport protein ChrA